MARHRLVGELRAELPPDLLADAVTVLAELVGNAVQHAEPLPGDVIRVAWRLRAGDGVVPPIVQVRVTDGGAAEWPRLRDVPADAAEGRGLGIVAALADRWGVERDGLGQSVWAEVSAS